MAAMNLRDYAETAKIAAVLGVVGVGGFLLYRAATSGISGKLLDLLGGAAETAYDNSALMAEMAGQWWNGTGGVDAGGASGRSMSWWGHVLTGDYADTKGVEATMAYIVIRAKDFNPNWSIKDYAYKAAVNMHSGNKTILEKYVLNGLTLKPAFQQLVKTTDFVVIYPDGSFKSA